MTRTWRRSAASLQLLLFMPTDLLAGLMSVNVFLRWRESHSEAIKQLYTSISFSFKEGYFMDVLNSQELGMGYEISQVFNLFAYRRTGKELKLKL